MVAEMLPAIEAGTGGSFNFTVGNCDRSIGARISGESHVVMATWAWKTVQLS